MVNKHRRASSKNVKKQETKTDLALLPQTLDNVVPVKLIMVTNIVDQKPAFERQFDQDYVINTFESMFARFYLDAMDKKEFYDMGKTQIPKLKLEI